MRRRAPCGWPNVFSAGAVAGNRAAMPMPEPATLSVIIPVGPGDHRWRTLLPDLAALPERAEIVLVATPGAAPADFAARVFGLRCHTQWIEAATGRASQQHTGDAQESGAVTSFVHADSRLTHPPHSERQRYR